MPTHHDETLPQRYEREQQAYLKLCGSMTAEQVADLQLQLNNSMAREQGLQALLTAADEREDVLEGLLHTSLVAMSRIYSAGRDFIVGAGSDCDSVELMMENDPTAREIRAALKPVGEGQ